MAVGLALATIDWRRWGGQAFTTLTTLVGVITLFSGVGYLYDVDALRGIAGRSGVAVHTVLALVALTVGLVCLRPDRGLVAVLRGADAGAHMARVLLPIGLLVPLAFGGLELEGQEQGVFGPQLGAAALTLATIAILTAVILVTARRLRSSDEEARQFTGIVASSDDAITRMDLEGRILSWNPAAERIYGYAAADILGRSVAVLIPPDRRDALFAVLARARAGEVSRLETQRVRADGRLIEVSLTISPVRDADGRVVGASSIVRDVTERHLAEAEARRLAGVVESSADAIVSFDVDGRFSSWNPGATALLGFTREEAIGRPVLSVVPEARREEFERCVEAVRRGETILGWETERLRKDGSLVEVEITVSPLSDADGNFTGMTAIVRNISERREAERRFRSLLEAAPDAMVIVDEAGIITLVNDQVERLLGYARNELLGERVERLLPLRLQDEHVAHRRGFAAEPHARAMGAGLDLVARHKDGHEVPVEVSLSPLQTDDGLLVIAAVRDVTARRRAERALAESEERFRRSFEDSSVGMALVLPDSYRRRLLEVNEALAAITGYSTDELRLMGPLTIVHPEDRPALTDDLRELMRAERAAVRREVRLVGATGNLIWTALTVSLVRDAAGEPVHAVVQVQDVSERKRFEGQLQYLADHDALTGLFNRRRFEEELRREVATARRYGHGGAVLVLDLDHFKLVNDSLGHAAGDELINVIARVMRRRLRASDIVGRMGGDEFAVVLPRADEYEARRIGETLLREIRADMRAASASGERRVTASIGIALFGDRPEELGAEELLAEADIAMYDAKEAGRDKLAVYDAQAPRHDRMETRLAWAQQIESALVHDQFVLHAQPILAVDESGERRYELLLRMVGDDGDLIPPGTFLYVAERHDLAGRIDRWVVRRALTLLAEQHRLGRDVSFEINLSAKSVNDADMLAFIADTIAELRVNPAKVIFEVTETAAIVNIAQAKIFVQGLRDIGCQFALDDFGAGFASFYYLKHLAFDYVKIDGEFIADLVGSHTNQLVVRSVADIAHGLGKRTIAEFVGDTSTIELLRQYGIDYVQGYFTGRPQPMEEIDFAASPGLAAAKPTGPHAPGRRRPGSPAGTPRSAAGRREPPDSTL